MTLDLYCAARHLLVSFSGKPFCFIDGALAARFAATLKHLLGDVRRIML